MNAFNILASAVFAFLLFGAFFFHWKRKIDKKLRAALQEKAELQKRFDQCRKMESMGLLVGGVAHDLNNILSGVVSYPEMLLKDPTLSPDHRELVEASLASGQRAVGVVSDLLTLARGVTCKKSPLNLNDLVNELINSPEFIELKKIHPDVEVKTDLADALDSINGSVLHIRKSLLNLIYNAVEAVAGKGVVRIQTSCVRLNTHRSGYTRIPAGNYAALTVSDTGGGISQEDMAKIFEPFYTRKVMGRSGTGLGLVVVWNTIQDHGGSIDVVSGPHGTEFRLYFAALRQVSRRPESVRRVSVMENCQGNGETILVIDDEATQRDIACRMLNLMGYKSASVESGEDALEYIKDNPVDLLVLDMYLKKGMNGADTFDKIRQIKSDQKAVIVSGLAEDRSVRRIQAAGAGDFLIKPYSMEDIGRAIKKQLVGSKNS